MMPCAPHSHDARRPSAGKRYTAPHWKIRDAWKARLADGEIIYCRRAPSGHCLEDDPVILPGSDWHLGHPDGECAAPIAPEHRRCNVSTAGRPGYL